MNFQCFHLLVDTVTCNSLLSKRGSHKDCNIRVEDVTEELSTFRDQWQMICKIETEQWHCEWRGLRLLPSPPTACAGWENMVREFWLALQNRKMSSCCMAFFYSAQLSHLFSSVCVFSCREWFNTETASKETAQAEKPKPQSGSSTPEFLSRGSGTRADADLAHHC